MMTFLMITTSLKHWRCHVKSYTEVDPHHPGNVSIDMSFQIEKHKNGNAFFLNLKNAHDILIDNYFTVVNWNHLRSFNNIDEAVKYCFNVIYKAIGAFVPCHCGETLM